MLQGLDDRRAEPIPESPKALSATEPAGFEAGARSLFRVQSARGTLSGMTQFEELLGKVRGLAGALAAFPGTRSIQLTISAAATEDEIREVQGERKGSEDEAAGDNEEIVRPLPTELVACARVADGASLEWRAELKDGTSVGGTIEIPSLSSLQEGITYSVGEGEGPGWSLCPSATEAEVVLTCEDERVVVLSSDSMCMAEDLDVLDAWFTMVRNLGMPGWERELDENQVLESEADAADEGRTIQALVEAVQAEIGWKF